MTRAAGGGRVLEGAGMREAETIAKGLTVAQRRAVLDGVAQGWVTRNRLVGMGVAARKTRQNPLVLTELGQSVRRLLTARAALAADEGGTP